MATIDIAIMILPKSNMPCPKLPFINPTDRKIVRKIKPITNQGKYFLILKKLNFNFFSVSFSIFSLLDLKIIPNKTTNGPRSNTLVNLTVVATLVEKSLTIEDAATTCETA